MASGNAMPSLQKAHLMAYATQNKKAFNPIVLNLNGVSELAEYFVIASGNTEIQVFSIFQEILRVCREEEISVLHVEGTQGSTWILIDLGDVIVHIFRKSERDYYNLEGLWDRAQRVALPKL